MADHLNPPQLEAVRTLRGPLLVLAGAGTGKTRVVTHRIAELIRHGTPAERILAVTFTNKAAAEMQQRTATLLGKRLNKRPEISTFHSLCVRVLRRQIQHLGYPPAFAIYDRGDQESIARAVLREIKRRTPNRCGPASCSISSAAGNRRPCGPRKPPKSPRPTKNIWPPPAIAAIKRRSKPPGPSISTICCS